MRNRRLFGLAALVGFPLTAYVGYPALVWAVAVLRPRPFFAGSGHRPRVTFVIPAHNEAERIGAKVRNTLDLDYPNERVNCIVVCDGCTDGTAASALAVNDPRLQVIELPRQQGKLAAIRAALPSVRSEIIALTDANVTLEAAALGHLVAPFADPSVAVVSGVKRVRDGPESIYWRYERWIRLRESASGSIAGADGALFAIRAAAADASHTAGAADDLLISLRAAQTTGRIVLAPGAQTMEPASPDARGSFNARARTTSGALFALASLPGLFRPAGGDLWWKLVGHKLVRVAIPPTMAAGVTALALAEPPTRTIRRTAAGIVLAAVLLCAGKSDGFDRLWMSGRYVLLANLAAVAGLARFLARRPIDAWSPHRPKQPD